MDVKVLVKEAIEVLKEHREKHIEDYKEAITAWREALTQYTKALEAWAQSDAGVSQNRPEQAIRPRNYLGEYDKLIKKLGHHREETIVLLDHEYSKIYEDAFSWQGQFQRQKAPIYTMGDASFGSLSASRIVSGSISSNSISIGEDSTHVPLEDE